MPTWSTDFGIFPTFFGGVPPVQGGDRRKLLLLLPGLQQASLAHRALTPASPVALTGGGACAPHSHRHIRRRRTRRRRTPSAPCCRRRRGCAALRAQLAATIPPVPAATAPPSPAKQGRCDHDNAVRGTSCSAPAGNPGCLHLPQTSANLIDWLTAGAVASLPQRPGQSQEAPSRVHRRPCRLEASEGPERLRCGRCYWHPYCG